LACRGGTAIPNVIIAAGLHWNVEDDNKAGKDMLDLDDYQVRKWTPTKAASAATGLRRVIPCPTRAPTGSWTEYRQLQI
jgi:hypothetical protein